MGFWDLLESTHSSFGKSSLTVMLTQIDNLLTQIVILSSKAQLTDISLVLGVGG